MPIISTSAYSSVYLFCQDVFIPSDSQGLAGDKVKNDETDVSHGTSSAKKAKIEEGIPIQK